VANVYIIYLIDKKITIEKWIFTAKRHIFPTSDFLLPHKTKKFTPVISKACFILQFFAKKA